MFVADMLSWWYSRGWGVFVEGFKTRLRDSADFFSFGQLFRTLFKPYRQISANSNERGLSAFFDKLISRVVGFFTRLFIILFGGVVMLLEFIFGGAMIVAWPFLPMLIVVGMVMTVTGVHL